MRIAIATAIIVTAASGAAACKKKASAQECDALLDHFAELVVKERFPDAGPEVITKERARERQEAKAADELKNCTSEVTPVEHACAMKASSSEAVIKCLE
jgi:hypothetical protein